MSDIVGTVNSQIIDATTGAVTLVSGQASPQSFGFVDVVMAETLGMVMYNAVSRQQGSGAISSAAVTAACARMLAARGMPAPPPPPAPDPPPFVMPLSSPPPDPSPSAAVATAFSTAEGALEFLRSKAAAAAAQSRAAQTELDTFIAQAGGIPPASPDAVANDIATAAAAINVLKARAADPSNGRAELDTLVAEAGGTPPTTPRVIQTPAPPVDPAVTEAFAKAKAAIVRLRVVTDLGEPGLSQTARTGLDQLIVQAGGRPPAPAIPPTVVTPTVVIPGKVVNAAEEVPAPVIVQPTAPTGATAPIGPTAPTGTTMPAGTTAPTGARGP